MSREPERFRMLPASDMAERGTVCSIILAPQVAGACGKRGVSADHFHNPAIGGIFSALMGMYTGAAPIDVITLTQRLADAGTLDLYGGAQHVSELFTYLPTATNFGQYLDILEFKHLLRQIITVCTRFASEAYDPLEQQEAMELLDRLERDVMAIRPRQRAARPILKETVMEVLGDLQTAYERPGEITGLTTGFDELDRITDGFHPEQLIVVAGRPSHGKSALMLNIVEHIALQLGKPVGVFSIEMNRKQLVHRLVMSRSNVNFVRFRDGHAESHDFPNITAAASQIAESPIHIDDTAGMSIQDMRSEARRMRADHKAEAIFVDYLQLLRSATRRASENRQQEVSEISGGLKECARELGIPIIALAQVGRDVEKEKRRPRLSDLRDSGAIEQDADDVLFVHRPELSLTDDDERSKVAGRAQLYVEKCRNGPLGEVDMMFRKEFTRFEQRARTPDSQQAEFLEVPPSRKKRYRTQTADD